MEDTSEGSRKGCARVYTETVITIEILIQERYGHLNERI